MIRRRYFNDLERHNVKRLQEQILAVAEIFAREPNAEPNAKRLAQRVVSDASPHRIADFLAGIGLSDGSVRAKLFALTGFNW